MQLLWGIAVLTLSILCWGGQALVCFAPASAVKLGLCEPESEVEPVFWADIRGEAYWDLLSLWTLAVAGVLLLVDHGAWRYFGLFGGGMYVYFAGRGVFARIAMQRRGLRIGSSGAVRLGLAFLVLWGLVGLVTAVAAALSLAQ